MSTTVTRRQTRLIARARKRLRRGLLSVTSIVATAAVVAAGIVAGTVAATAAPGDVTTPDFGTYEGPRVVQLADGGQHVIGLDEDGTVWGWGVNDNRQVTGDSTTFGPATEVTSVSALLVDGESVVQVASGLKTSYAVTSEGRVISWGADSSYALGRNTSVAAPNFVLTNATTQLAGITKLDAGDSHVIALDEAGNVWGWGLNTWAQLGINNTANQRYAVQNPYLSGVTEVTAGTFHSAAIVNGKVKAWGNNSGYLGVGNGSTAPTYVPTDVVTTSGMTGEIVSIAAGLTTYATYTLAVDSDGQVWSWGYDHVSATLGRPGAVGVPGRVLGADNNALTGITKVAAGVFDNYALASDGTAYSWGWNNYGQAGVGNTAGVNRATKIRNFDLDAGVYGAELSGIESISAGSARLGIISTVGDDEGVVSIAGFVNRLGLATGPHALVPNLVWKFAHSFKELPLTLVPRDGKTYPNRVVNDANLVQRDAGTLNYGMTPFELREVTAESTSEYGIPVTYALGGYCSMNQTTKVVTVNYAAYCDITRSFAATALVKAIPTETWRVNIGKAIQNITPLGTTAAPGEILQDINTDSAPIALPILTDAPYSQGGIVYRITQGNPDICKLSAYDGVSTNVQRYIQPLGEGLCEITAVQTQSSGSNMESVTKIVQFEIGAGRQPQSLDLSGLNGIRYHATNQTHTLPSVTTVGGETVSYTVASGPCTVSGTTLTATGAGNCVLTVTAPAGDGGANGYFAYADTKTVVVGKGVQSLNVDGVFDSLTVATSTSAELSTETAQGIALSNWSAVAAPGETAVDVCSVVEGRVLAGDDAPQNVGDAPVDCLVTVSNAGDANYEPYTFSSVVTIDPRDSQTLNLSVLDGKKFGDAPFDLPATTVQGVAVTYTASGSCEVDGTEVTILSGGDCVITASAAGTIGTDGDPSYRPYSVVKTAPVAAIGQFVNGMPALNALKVGSVSGALPVQTAQGKTVTWAATTPAICELVADADTGLQRVRIIADGDCTITGSAPGDTNYTPFAFALTFAAAINYEGLDAEIAAAIDSNDDGAGNPRYTADTWAAYEDALSAAEDAQEPNGVSQGNVDALQQELIAAKAALVDLSVLREAYNNRVTSSAPYTPASWAVYQQAVADALDVLENDADATADEVTAAADALYAATGALVLLADKVALQAEADSASALVESDYIAGGWADYQDALAAAEAVLADANASQVEVDAALAALQDAKAALVDISELTKVVGDENEFDRQEGHFTPGTWEAYADALADAEAVLADPNATQAEVDAALEALRLATSELQWTEQLNPTLLDTITDLAIGDAPVTLPTLTDRGAVITYEVDAASAEICQIIDGRLYIVGFGDCVINWSAPAIGNFPASTGSEEAPTGPGIQLIVDGVQVLEGDTVNAGQALIARGGGLEPGSTLTVELRPGQRVLGTAVVGADGTATVNFVIPDEIRPGTYTVHASGVSSVDGSTVTRSANVAVQNLAFTGAEVLPLAAGSLLFLLAGLGLMLLARRNRETAV